ncbi:cation:H+ antiporter [Geosporobacter subterraneus DSM 17957]|uniref:Cation:H+ antiporter n=1 Tax=Geosporobacter subterraneus DSM 17957 TaxID=1121919 RepID=A0A1M6BP90_9FIRM|nr:calcium/sodium antiporter [Geosporobacter subterraneus]SHI50535.1 cation:H+ antiporter [Geosporobacter subterraneus DSM 17957]
MDNFIVFAMFFLGLIIIIKGGDLFVEAAIWIAVITGIPTIIIGATLVSLATTLPEFFVSTIASSKGYTEMAIGNAIGSTICNMGLILGACAIISPVAIRRKFFSFKGLLMIGSLMIFYYFASDFIVDEIEGYMLLMILILYIIINISELRGTTAGVYTTKEKLTILLLATNVLKFTIGAGMIILGARLLVDNGVTIANIFNVPEQIISLTLIALGTSLPELITSITAVIKGHMGISVGNIIGANILNLTMVLGTSSLLSGKGLMISVRDLHILDHVLVNVPQTLVLDIPVSLLMMSVLVLCGTYKRMIDRIHGFLLLCIYSSYLFALYYITF